MQSMVDRWKDKLSSIQQKSIPSNTNLSPIPPHPPSKTSQHIQSQQQLNMMKKSIDKSKRSLHSHQGKSKRMTTPSKSNNKKSNKNIKLQFIQRACDEIFQIFGKAKADDKSIPNKIKYVLEQLWSKCIQTIQAVSPRNINVPTATQMDVSIMKQSTLSAGTAKKQQKLYQDLQKKYFQCEKQKQFLKNKIDSLLLKYESVDKQLQKYSKMQKLIQNCIQRQQQAREDNKRLKNQLRIAQLKQIEQQRIFQEQINNKLREICQLFEELQQCKARIIIFAEQ